MRSVFYLSTAIVFALITIGCGEDKSPPETKVRVRAPFVQIETEANGGNFTVSQPADNAPPQTVAIGTLEAGASVTVSIPIDTPRKSETTTGAKRKCERSLLCRPIRVCKTVVSNHRTHCKQKLRFGVGTFGKHCFGTRF